MVMAIMVRLGDGVIWVVAGKTIVAVVAVWLRMGMFIMVIIEAMMA